MNTLMLYFRMILIMAVNLYSSRIILQYLGINDYGIYNVVGGIVMMLAFITSSIGAATSRFITFELGKNDGNVENLFRISSTIFYIFSIIVFLLAETMGLWFVSTKLNIPADRATAAMWVYQCSVITFIISLISIPYNALIIAYERMSAFAYISVYEAIAKLGIIFMLPFVSIDRLIFYAILLMLVQLSVRIIYASYSKKQFKEANGKWLWDKERSRELFVYAGWQISGHLAIVGYTQGINILLNIFFGPAVNAARAIATQVQSALSQFFGNFQTAIRPQVIKSYAQGDMQYMHSLILRAARLSFMLAILIGVPIFAFADYILNLWLMNPPKHVVAFVQITLIAGISNSLSQHTLMAIHATGNIKKFQLVEGACLLSIVPIAYVLLKFFNVAAEVVIVVYVTVEALTQFVRVALVYPKIDLPIKFFFTKVLAQSLLVLAICSLIAYIFILKAYPINFLQFMVCAGSMVILECIVIFLFGLDKNEKNLVSTKLYELACKYIDR